MAQIGSSGRRKKEGKNGSEKSGRNQDRKNRRMEEKKAAINLERFAGSSEDEDEVETKVSNNKRNKKEPVVVEGKRFAKRARKELAAQKKKQEHKELASQKKEQEELQVVAAPESESTTAVATVTTSTKSSESTKTTKNKLSKPSPPSGWQLQGGVVAKDIKIGAGKPAKPGCTVCITYTGILPDSGKVFDTNTNFKFTIGDGEVVRGMELGVAGMKKGGERMITIPPKMGYGRKGSPPEIPSNATLEFRVQLLSFKMATVVAPVFCE